MLQSQTQLVIFTSQCLKMSFSIKDLVFKMPEKYPLQLLQAQDNGGEYLVLPQQIQITM